MAACTATFCGAAVGTVPREGDSVTALLGPGQAKAPLDVGHHCLVLAQARSTRRVEPPPCSSPHKAGPAETHQLHPQRPPGGGWGDPHPLRCTRSCGSRSAGACSGLGGKGEEVSRALPVATGVGALRLPSLGSSTRSNRDGQAEVSLGKGRSDDPTVQADRGKKHTGVAVGKTHTGRVTEADTYCPARTG